MESRRGFLRKLGIASAMAVSVGTVGAIASNNKKSYNSNGVVVGHSPKKEILYKKTRAWEDFYNSAV
jgi:hypothetical protein